MSPKNSAVLSVFNNRPIAFDRSRVFTKELEDAEPKLLKAVECSRNLTPADTVECYCNVGCFYFIQQRYSDAERYFSLALADGRKIHSYDSPSLAPLLEYDAIALRGAATLTTDDNVRHEQYNRAEAILLEALRIRTTSAGYYQSDIAYCLMNLAALYHDRALDDRLASPQQIEAFSTKAHALEQEVDRLMNANAKTAKALMDEALEHRTKADSTANSDPNESWRHKTHSQNLVAQASELGNNMVLVNSRSRSDVASSTTDLSNAPCARPSYPYMPTNNGLPQLQKMIAFAESISDQGCKPPPPPRSKRLPGYATIIGTWKVESDITTRAAITTPSTTNETVNGLEHVEGHGEQQSRVANQEIFLCPASSYNALQGVIARFAEDKGLAMDDFQKTWPANHQQGEALLLKMKDMADRIKMDTTKSDKNGDYEIGTSGAINSTNGRIPSGSYFLYGSIVTQNECAFWLLPGGSGWIGVTEKHQFHFNFDRDSAQIVWTKRN